MINLKFKLETVTPLFCGGADKGLVPELRASSIRGALRFWLRALLGGVLGDRPDEIFRHESQVFGSTDHASPVVVRIQAKREEFLDLAESWFKGALKELGIGAKTSSDYGYWDEH